MSDLMKKLSVPAALERLIETSHAPVSLVISISGGKDSDTLCQLLPRFIQQKGWAEHVSISLVHADMGRAEWLFTTGYVKRRAAELALPLTIVARSQGDLLDLFRRRHEKRPDAAPFPSAAFRYCTSDK